jgi:hypothetical protein
MVLTVDLNCHGAEQDETFPAHGNIMLNTRYLEEQSISY